MVRTSIKTGNPTFGKGDVCQVKSKLLPVIPLFAYAPEIRKVIYTTNAIESLNYSPRKLIKARASFPNDEAALKLLYLGLRNISQRWTMPIQNWKQATSQLMIRFEEQFNRA